MVTKAEPYVKALPKASGFFYTTGSMWASYRQNGTRRGFTIVELLIVIVVIAILAAIVIIAYNSVQARANFSKEQQDLKSITKALGLYHVDNGSYPISVGRPGCTYDWCGWDQVTGNNFINGLSPQYISQLPQMPTANAANDTYLYRSDASGANYQLLRYKASGLPAVEMQNNSLLATTQGYNGLAWGYRTNTDGIWW